VGVKIFHGFSGGEVMDLTEEEFGLRDRYGINLMVYSPRNGCMAETFP
jgi:hypothetical protein